MARVLALIPDLLFGSKVKSSLTVAGHDVQLVGAVGGDALRGQLDGVQLLIVDLTDPELDGSGLVQALREDGSLAGKPTLGFYSHVDIEARERAEQAGFSLVVPRSRMAREGAQLAEGLLAG